MKTAVISWKFENFGTLLQAYALNYYLNSLESVDCDFVFYDLEKDNLDIPFRKISMETPKKIYKYIFRKSKPSFDKKQAMLEQKVLCEAFFEKIKHTDRIEKKDLKRLNLEYDAFICGSDQIWNPRYFDRSYFLDFVQDEKKKIAFAPSMGGCNIPIRLKKSYKSLLCRFDCLSSREIESCSQISKLTGKKCEYIADPTILLTANEWVNALQIDSYKLKKKVLLCYFLSPQSWYMDYVVRISRMYNMDIVYLKNAESDFLEEFSGFKILKGGPETFVSAIAGATYIITDSFHGTLFSTFFEKEFITFQRFKDTGKMSENMRVTSFLNSVNLLERFVCEGDEMNCNMGRVDYKPVKVALDKRRKVAKQYLFEALGLGGK